jgi:hypothetical protein
MDNFRGTRSGFPVFQRNTQIKRLKISHGVTKVIPSTLTAGKMQKRALEPSKILRQRLKIKKMKIFTELGEL